MSRSEKTTESLLSRLFKWTTSVDINGVKLYVRIVADSTIEDARRHALLTARKLRVALRDVSSDEYLISLEPFDYDWNRENLLAYIQISAAKEVMQEYISSNPKPQLTKLGDNPTQEDLENLEVDKIERDAEYLKAAQEYVEDWRQRFLADLEKRTDDDLRIIAKKYKTDELANALYEKSFEDYILCNSVYTDTNLKQKAFTLEEYKELPNEIKQKFYDAYNSINIGSDDLKN